MSNVHWMAPPLASFTFFQEMPATAINNAFIPVKKALFALHFEIVSHNSHSSILPIVLSRDLQVDQFHKLFWNSPFECLPIRHMLTFAALERSNPQQLCLCTDSARSWCSPSPCSSSSDGTLTHAAYTSCARTWSHPQPSLGFHERFVLPQHARASNGSPCSPPSWWISWVTPFRQQWTKRTNWSSSSMRSKPSNKGFLEMLSYAPTPSKEMMVGLQPSFETKTYENSDVAASICPTQT